MHVGAGQNILDGYDNVDAYNNDNRPEFFQTSVSKFVRAELLDSALADGISGVCSSSSTVPP